MPKTDTANAMPIDAATRRRRVPARRYGVPEEIAHMVLNLALPSASFVTGTTIPVDGGLTIQNT